MGELIYKTFENIIRNAVKYAVEASEITLHGEMSAERLRARIEDHGPGVGQDDSNKSFSHSRVVRKVDTVSGLRSPDKSSSVMAAASVHRYRMPAVSPLPSKPSNFLTNPAARGPAGDQVWVPAAVGQEIETALFAEALMVARPFSNGLHLLPNFTLALQLLTLASLKSEPVFRFKGFTNKCPLVSSTPPHPKSGAFLFPATWSFYAEMTKSGGPLAKANLRMDSVAVLAKKAIDHPFCMNHNDRFKVVASEESADLVVHAKVTHIVATNKATAVTSTVRLT